MYHLTNITSLILETYYGEGLVLWLGLDKKYLHNISEVIREGRAQIGMNF